MKRLLTALLAVVLLLSLAACGAQGQKMKIETDGINQSKFVDAETGAKIEYDTLVIIDEEAYPWGGGTVDGMTVYLFDGEAMDGKGVTVLGVEDELYYTLEDGTLTITKIDSALPEDWSEKGSFVKY